MTPSLPRPARIAHIQDENPRTRTLTFELRLEAGPGQFVMGWLPGVDEKPFSLLRAEPVTMTIARVGPFTESVFALAPGDRFWIRGPLGRSFTLPTEPRCPILLLAGGYGVAPLHFLAERARVAGLAVHVVIGARTAADVIFADRFAALGAEVVVTTDDGSLGQRGLVTDAARRLLAEGRFAAVYACGPEPMLEAVETLARTCNLPAQLSHERYMRCGFGVCGSCARQGWLVCRDGPVKSFQMR